MIDLGATEIDSSDPLAGTRPKRSIFPTAKLTDANNSSKPALKSHRAVADAQRTADARKAADAAVVSAGANVSASSLETPLLSLSRSSSQVLPSRGTSPSTRPVSSDDELEESVRAPKGKRKAIGMFPQVHTIRRFRSLITDLISVNVDTHSEPSMDSKSVGFRKKKSMYVALLYLTCDNHVFQP